MSMSDVVKVVDGFICKAIEHGQKEVADFWRQFGAGMTASLFRDAAMSKQAFGLFELAGPAMYEQLKAEIAMLQPEARPEIFENLRVVAIQMQQDGRLTPEQADLSRRIIQQVEQELGG